MQHAVDPVAHLELVLEWLDMDVRGPLLDRPIDRQVDEPDDGRLARQVAEVVDVLLVIAEVLERVLGGLRCSPGRRRIAVPVRGLEPLEDVALARDSRLDLEPRGDAQTLQRVVVGRVGHRDGERPVGLPERENLGVLPELEVHAAERHRDRGEVTAVDRLDAEIRRNEGQEVVLGDEAEIEQQTLQTLAALLLEALDLTEIVDAEASLL